MTSCFTSLTDVCCAKKLPIERSSSICLYLPPVLFYCRWSTPITTRKWVFLRGKSLWLPLPVSQYSQYLLDAWSVHRALSTSGLFLDLEANMFWSASTQTVSFARIMYFVTFLNASVRNSGFVYLLDVRSPSKISINLFGGSPVQ